MDIMPDCKTQFLQAGVSDHSPMHMNFLYDNPRRRKAFKYCNMWSSPPQFNKIVNKVLNTQGVGCCMYQIVTKLKALKAKLRGMHNAHFNNLMNEVEDGRKKIKNLQEQLQMDPLNNVLQEKERRQAREFKGLAI